MAGGRNVSASNSCSRGGVEASTSHLKRGLPHSCPVSLKASGGTPLTSLGAPDAAALTSRTFASGSLCVINELAAAGGAPTRTALTKPRMCVNQARRGICCLTVKLEEALIGPHVSGLPAHIDGDVPHNVDALGVRIRLPARKQSCGLAVLASLLLTSPGSAGALARQRTARLEQQNARSTL